METMNLLARAAKIGVEGFLHCAELERLADLACGRDVLEVGSFRGLSAWGMAASARSLVCVDTFSANSAGQDQQATLTTLDDFRRSVARYSNVDVYVGTSEAAADSWPGEREYDLVFLDAMHTYPDVKADSLRWWPRLRAGGVFAFHDYGHGDFPGVLQAVDEMFGPAPEGTVLVTLRWIEKP